MGPPARYALLWFQRRNRISAAVLPIDLTEPHGKARIVGFRSNPGRMFLSALPAARRRLLLPYLRPATGPSGPALIAWQPDCRLLHE